MTRRISQFGWQRDNPDHRDRVYNQLDRIAGPETLSATGGLDPSVLPPIWQQGEIGSCVPHGTLRAFLAEATKQGLSLPMLSRLFVYAEGRLLEGTSLSDDAGMEVRDAIKVLAKMGVPPEPEWPYSDANPGPFSKRPPASVVADAKRHMAIRYKRITLGPGAPMRTALHAGYAIAFGFSVPATFEDGSWDPASGEPLPLPGPNDGFVGGHCVAATKFDWTCKVVSGVGGFFRQPPFFTCDNSWGELWGMAGRFNIHADYFGTGLATDMWIVQQDD